MGLQITANPPDLVALKIDAQVEMPKVVDTRSSCFSLMLGLQARLFSFGGRFSSLKTIANGTDHV